MMKRDRKCTQLTQSGYELTTCNGELSKVLVQKCSDAHRTQTPLYSCSNGLA